MILNRATSLAFLLILPLGSLAATLQAGTGAGDTASIVALCVHGSHSNGGADLRGCSDDSGRLANAGPLSSVSAESTAIYPGYTTGMTVEAKAWGSLGTLHAFAMTDVPVTDAIGHNAQSSAQIRMVDSLLVKALPGVAFVNYSFSIPITGSKTAESPFIYDIPHLSAFAYAVVDIRNPKCTPCYFNQTWISTDTAPTGTISGTLLNVPVGTTLEFDITLAAQSGVATSANGLGGFAQADYSHTLHFYLDALTPGANTVANSGFDYATPVPEAPTAALLLSGFALLSVIAPRTNRARS